MKAGSYRDVFGLLVFLFSSFAVFPVASIAQQADDFVGNTNASAGDASLIQQSPEPPNRVNPTPAPLATNSPPPLPQPVASTLIWTQPESAVSEFSMRHELQRQVFFADGSHRIEPQARNYNEIGSGLAYKDTNGKWHRSSVVPEIQAGGSVAFRNLPVAYSFAADANSETVLEYEASSRARARSGLAGLVYMDLKQERFVLFAPVKNSTVQAFDGGVYYTNVLDGADADLVYKVHPWGIEQDVVLFGELPAPKDLGLSDAETRLCILTELVKTDLETLGVDRESGVGPSDSSPAPLELSSRAQVGFDRLYNLQRCYAYAEEAGGVTLAGQGQGLESDDPVSMRLIALGGRLYLSEELPVAHLSESNPYLFTAAPGKACELVTADRLNVPARPSRAEVARDARPRPDARQAAYTPRATPCYVVDYVNYLGTVTNNLVFQSGVTYFVSSDLILSGAKLTIEPGAFVKLATNSQIKFQSGASIESKATAISPAIFTSIADTNVGEIISTGNPAANRYAAGFYFETGSNQLVGIDFRYANYGIRVRPGSQGARIKDCSFSYGGAYAVEAASGTATTEVRNCLFRLSGGGINGASGAVRVASCTFEQIALAVSNAAAMQWTIIENSLFASVSNVCKHGGASTTLTHNACWNSPTGGLGADVIVLTNNPFVSGPYGAFYLQQTTNLVDRGTTNANKVGLYHYTTASNQVKETTNIVDIGFHYATMTDYDSDGLPDYQEDADGDGVYTNASDLSNWKVADTDGDGLNDGTEVNIYGTNPKVTDTDGDGYSDGVEVKGGSNPLATNSYLTSISGTIANPTPVSGPIHVYARSGPATNGLVLHYSFASNRYGIVSDLSGCGHTGYVSGATYVTNGPGGWYAFDGADDYIRVTNNASLNPTQFTIAAWAKTYEAPAVVTRGLFGKHRAGFDNNSYLMPAEQSELQGRLYGAGATPGRLTVNPSLLLNQWSHMALTYDGTNWRLYTNGSLSAVTNVSGYQGNAFDLLIGAGELTSGTAVPSLFWKGTIDDVTLYNRALSSNELANLYGAGVNAYLLRETAIAGTGAYTITNAPTLKTYVVTAWLDSNTNGVMERWEPRGEYAGNPLTISGPVGGINIVVIEPDADGDGTSDRVELEAGTDPDDPTSFPITLSGTVSYTGGQTGLIRVLSALETGLVLRATFNEASGPTAYDYSGLGNHAAISGSVRIAEGYSGKACDYDGVDDFAQAQDSASLDVQGPLTIMAWVKGQNFATVQGLAMKHDDSSQRAYGFYFDGVGATLQLSSDGGGTPLYQIRTTNLPPTGVWTHVTTTWDGTPNGGGKIYYNGIQQYIQTTRTSFSGTNIFNSSRPFRIGGKSNGGWPFKGALDEVQVYDRCLSSQEVASVCRQGVTTPRTVFTNIAVPGAYAIGNVPNRISIALSAFRDSNTNGILNFTEASGVYPTNNLWPTGSVSGLNITLTDPDTDSDGMPDWWEIKYGLNPSSGVSSAMAGWWKFDEGSGTNIANSAASTNHGFMVNMSAASWTTGKLGNALSLDGTDDYVRIPQNPAIVTGGQFTVSAWTWYDGSALDSYPSVIGDMTNSGSGYPGYWMGCDRYAEGAACLVGTSNGYIYPLSSENITNRWVHLAATYDGTSARLYVDGIQKAAGNGPFAAAKLAELKIGWADDSIDTYHWKGKLDDVRLYKTALSSNAVCTLYDALRDMDGDGLSNVDEYEQGTRPDIGDTDGDGMKDGDEVNQGYDPLIFNEDASVSIRFPEDGRRLP